MMRRVPPVVLAAALIAAGCAHSPPTRTLTLDAAPPAPAAVRADYHGAPIAIPAVHVPAVLDRPEFVHQDQAGVVAVDDFARWGAPLGLLARDALVRDITARLPAGAVLPPGASAPKARAIGVTILFLGADGAAVRMDVAYRTLPNGPVMQASFTDAGTPADPAATAQAYGRLLGLLADRIVAGLPR